MSRNDTPRLTRLKYGSPFCELCRDPIHAGQPVAWWRVPGKGGRKRKTVYCASCHWSNVRLGKALR